ncbi:hypothetical protein Hypma_011174 [Hypsizygus marmoreus]|uniref:Uncharacterized protein n=1 Tax=Hypsizygus marmoreus TaxID=39966 RepID=A0A369JM25_HYPMA|nr:hypothetical protein Hypma_011174 [Hypsizygus marmoreus]
MDHGDQVTTLRGFDKAEQHNSELPSTRANHCISRTGFTTTWKRRRYSNLLCDIKIAFHYTDPRTSNVS